MRWILSLLVVVCLQPRLAAQESRSAPLARELAGLLAERKLDAYAVQSRDTADEFVAVLFFPNEQLLVVAARSTAPAALAAELASKDYLEAYALLQQAAVPETKFFFHDMKADGLHAKSATGADVAYERVVAQTIFDGQPSRHQLTDREYAEKFASADERYSRLLSALIAGLKTS
jgi:hypothetical protein